MCACVPAVSFTWEGSALGFLKYILVRLWKCNLVRARAIRPADMVPA